MRHSKKKKSYNMNKYYNDDRRGIYYDELLL